MMSSCISEVQNPLKHTLKYNVELRSNIDTAAIILSYSDDSDSSVESFHHVQCIEVHVIHLIDFENIRSTPWVNKYHVLWCGETVSSRLYTAWVQPMLCVCSIRTRCVKQNPLAKKYIIYSFTRHRACPGLCATKNYKSICNCIKQFMKQFSSSYFDSAPIHLHHLVIMAVRLTTFKTPKHRRRRQGPGELENSTTVVQQ